MNARSCGNTVRRAKRAERDFRIERTSRNVGGGDRDAIGIVQRDIQNVRTADRGLVLAQIRPVAVRVHATAVKELVWLQHMSRKYLQQTQQMAGCGNDWHTQKTSMIHRPRVPSYASDMAAVVSGQNSEVGWNVRHTCHHNKAKNVTNSNIVCVDGSTNEPCVNPRPVAVDSSALV
jgi:hypothetical protein